MTGLYVAWRDPHHRRWHTVGRLDRSGDMFRFLYTHGALAAMREGSFRPFPSFPDLNVAYESPELFPFFANRLLSKARPEYSSFVSWISLPQQEEDPFALLSFSTGMRESDSLELFPAPEPRRDGTYHIHFFVHGLSHLPECSLRRAERLQNGERLLACRDLQNPHDKNALLLRTVEQSAKDIYLVGFCPRYLAEDVTTILSKGGETEVSVVRVNPPDAPVQFKVLCCMVLRPPAGTTPFEGPRYQPIVSPRSRLLR